MGKHVFLSYSRTDTQMMQMVRQALQAAGVAVWTDEGITPGTPNWQMAIEQALENASAIVVLLSPESKESKWVREELGYAENEEIPVIPLLVAGDSSNAIPFGLSKSQWIDLRENPEEGLKKLAAALSQPGEAVNIPAKISAQKGLLGFLQAAVRYPFSSVERKALHFVIWSLVGAGTTYLYLKYLLNFWPYRFFANPFTMVIYGTVLAGLLSLLLIRRWRIIPVLVSGIPLSLLYILIYISHICSIRLLSGQAEPGMTYAACWFELSANYRLFSWQLLVTYYLIWVILGALVLGAARWIEKQDG